MFRSPPSRFSSVSAGDSPRPLMSPQLSPSGPPLPLYDGPGSGYPTVEDQFNRFSFQQGPPPGASRVGMSPPSMPYPNMPRGMPGHIVRGSPDDALNFSSRMLLQDAAPMRRRGSAAYPPPSGSGVGPSTYSHPIYPAPQHPSMYPYPNTAPSPRPRSHTPSPTSSDFMDLRQFPRY